LNLQPSGYEPDELPIAPPRDINFFKEFYSFLFQILEDKYNY